MAFSILGAAAQDQDFAVSEQPTDGISSLSWSPAADFLTASSWDGKVRVYQVSGNAAQIIATYEHGAGQPAPVLESVWSRAGDRIYSVGADNRAVAYDPTSQQTMQFGQHDAPIKSVRPVTLGQDPTEYIATGSWDKTIRYWDPRQQKEMAKVQLLERCYSMDFVAPWLVVATADRHIGSCNLGAGNPNNMTWGTSTLKWQTRVIACFPALANEMRSLPSQALKPDQAHGYCVASIEGRIGVMYHDPPTQKEHGFTFRCHRKEFKAGLEGQKERQKAQQEGKLMDYGAFAVNSVSFNSNGTYCTAGSDGGISFWDNYSKSRLKQFDKKPGPISAAAYNRSAEYFAYAVSYDWSQGHMGNAPGRPNAVMVHRCKAEEVRRKPKR